MRILAFLLAVLSGAVAQGAQPYCKIFGGESWSSGTVIARFKDGSGQILTCAHGKKSGEKVTVNFHGTMGTNDQGFVSAIDEDADLAIVSVSVCRANPIKLATIGAFEGEQVSINGYGKNEYSERKTKIIGISKLAGLDGTFVQIEAISRPGDSGAGLIATNAGVKSLVGVNVRGDGKDGWAVPVETVHKFMKEQAELASRRPKIHVVDNPLLRLRTPAFPNGIPPLGTYGPRLSR